MTYLINVTESNDTNSIERLVSPPLDETELIQELVSYAQYKLAATNF